MTHFDGTEEYIDMPAFSISLYSVPLEDGWFQVYSYTLHHKTKRGWPLVWDSIRAAIKKRDISFYDAPTTFTCMIKPDGKLKVEKTNNKGSE